MVVIKLVIIISSLLFIIDIIVLTAWLTDVSVQAVYKIICTTIVLC